MHISNNCERDLLMNTKLLKEELIERKLININYTYVIRTRDNYYVTYA